jgi:hypothetical protein
MHETAAMDNWTKRFIFRDARLLYYSISSYTKPQRVAY